MIYVLLLLIRRMFKWLPMALIFCTLLNSQPAHAGWFSWLGGNSGNRQLERSAELAHEAARVANETASLQAQQAMAQAEQATQQAAQNSRVAEVLAQLSTERQDYAEHIKSLLEHSLQDSQIAAVLSSSGPVLLCVTVLLVAGLALWLVSRGGHAESQELADAMDVLVEELAVCAREPSGPGGFELGYSKGLLGGNSHRESRPQKRLPVVAGFVSGPVDFGPGNDHEGGRPDPDDGLPF